MRNLNPIPCSECGEFRFDLYLNTHNGEDRFICSDCIDEIMDRTEGEQDGTRNIKGRCRDWWV